MKTATKTGLALGGALLAAWTGWGLYSRRSADSIPYEAFRRLEELEIRRYPRTVLAETTAPDEVTAFRRLFRYISGENRASESISMTTPVETQTGRGQKLAMTAPVRSGSDTEAGDTRMGFFLPMDYGPETVPEPTDSTVRLVIEPPKTVAASGFSWYAPRWRVDRIERDLIDILERHEVTRLGGPTLLRYNDPWTPPFLRRNEVVVEIDETTLPR